MAASKKSSEALKAYLLDEVKGAVVKREEAVRKAKQALKKVEEDDYGFKAEANPKSRHYSTPGAQPELEVGVQHAELEETLRMLCLHYKMVNRKSPTTQTQEDADIVVWAVTPGENILLDKKFWLSTIRKVERELTKPYRK